MMRIRPITVLPFLVTIALAGPVPAAPIGTDFTYQGVLANGGTPVDGIFDFRFILYDAESGGSQVGTTQYVEDLSVTNGRVVTQIDFGAVFDDTGVWLEIGVRDGGSSDAYTVLSPRQPITAGPYALRAASAGDADLLGGEPASFYLDWSNLTGLPGGLDDGDDDTLADLSCGDDEIAKWSGSAWVCSADLGAYASTYVVGPVGSDLENGAALVAAAAALPTGHDVRLQIEPGAYDLGDQSLDVPSGVAVFGSGPSATFITSTVCTSATVDLDSYSDLHGVYIVTSCPDSGSWAYGIKCQYANTIDDVKVSVGAEGNHKYGVYSGSGYLTLRHATIYVNCGTADYCWGASLYSGGALVDVDIKLVGTADSATGIYASYPPELSDVTVSAYGSGSETYGVRFLSSSGFSTSGVDAQATNTSATGDAYGIWLQAGNDNYVEVRNVVASASDSGSGTSYGLYFSRGIPILDHADLAGEVALYYDAANTTGLTVTNSTLGGSVTAIQADTIYSAFPVIVENSLLTGITNTIQVTGTACPVSVAGSRLAGGVISGASATTCAGVWDENFTFYASSCP